MGRKTTYRPPRQVPRATVLRGIGPGTARRLYTAQCLCTYINTISSDTHHSITVPAEQKGLTAQRPLTTPSPHSRACLARPAPLRDPPGVSGTP